MDVSKDWIAVAVMQPEHDAPSVVEKIFHDEVSIRRFVKQFRSPARLAVCYEAGPTGYELHRLPSSMGVACEVIAPSLIPRAPGDRVKTDRRDAKKLVRLYRSGQLVAIRVPTPAEEAVRDACRARADIVDDSSRARKRLGAFLLRHNHIYRDGTRWTAKHHQWLRAQRFEERAMTVTFNHYLGIVESREAELEAMEAELRPWLEHSLFSDQIARLCAYRVSPASGRSPMSAKSATGDASRPPAPSGLLRPDRLGVLLTGHRPSPTRRCVRRGHVGDGRDGLGRTPPCQDSGAWAARFQESAVRSSRRPRSFRSRRTARRRFICARSA
jgi:hypothetical protein